MLRLSILCSGLQPMLTFLLLLECITPFHYGRSQKRACILNSHNAVVKDVKWSSQGLFVLPCCYDCTSRLVDVENGINVQIFKEDQIVQFVKFCPYNHNLFLSGVKRPL